MNFDGYVDLKWIVLSGCIVFLSLLFLMFFVCMSKSCKCEFLDSHINVKWALGSYRKIAYESILGIKIDGAYNTSYFEIRDMKGKQKAVISLYESKNSFLTGLLASGMSIIPSYEPNCLCYSYFNKADFQMLLRKTNVSVFITLEMFLLYREELYNIFEEYPNRIMVACLMGANDSRQLVSYENLKNKYRIEWKQNIE